MKKATRGIFNPDYMKDKDFANEIWEKLRDAGWRIDIRMKREKNRTMCIIAVK